MASRRLPLARKIVHSAVQEGQDFASHTVMYKPHLTASDAPTTFDNDGQFDSHLPIKIYAYEWEIVSSALVYAYQTYQDSADQITYNFDVDDNTRAIKQDVTVPGTLTAYATQWETDDELTGVLGDPESTVTEAAVVADWAVRKIKFNAKKNKGKDRKRYGKWKVSPIVLSPDMLDKCQWRIYVQNTNSNTTDSHVYSKLKITSWRQFT